MQAMTIPEGQNMARVKIEYVPQQKIMPLVELKEMLIFFLSFSSDVGPI